MKRRNMLRKAGIGSAMGIVTLTNNTVSANSGKDEYVGVVYDPVKGIIQGEASLEEVSLSDGLKGKLLMRNPHFSSKDINLELHQENPIKTENIGPHKKPRVDYKTVVHSRSIQDSYTSANKQLPLVARTFTIPGEEVSGIVRPLGSSNKSAFYLSKKRPSTARSEIRKRIKHKIPKMKSMEEWK